MKKYLFFSMLLTIGIVQSCEKQSAADYNDNIIKEQIKIVDNIDAVKKNINNYFTMSENEAFPLMDAAIQHADIQLDSSLNFANNLENFKGSDGLKKATIALFEEYKTILGKYKRIIELYKIPEDNYQPADAIELENLQTECLALESSCYYKFVEAQKEFATANNLTFTY